MAEFVRFLQTEGRITFEVPPVRGHAYLLEGASSRPKVGDGVLLVGDAAGLAYPQSGEGILPAVESGLLAAKSILAANGSFEKKRLVQSQTHFASERRNTTLSVGRLLPSTCINPFAKALLRTHWFVREIVLDRWFLHEGSRVTPKSTQLAAH
jgi:flavin-dependent dehydrogenase